MRKIRLGLAAVALIVPIVVGPNLTSSGGATVFAEGNSGVVRTWNEQALTALASQPPNVAGLHMGIVQAAVFDAVNAIDGGHEPFLQGLPEAPDGASIDAAAATAAYRVLTLANLAAAYQATLAGVPDGAAEDGGVQIGNAVATAMLAARATDGRYGPFTVPIGTGVGEWRPTTPGVTDPAGWLAHVDPLVALSPDQFRTNGPLPVSSPSYAREYDEVKSLGAVGSPRSPEQQALADFYNVSPVALFNRTFRAVSVTEGLTAVEDARLFAMLNVTAADAFINCWNDKAYWNVWRPVTAIRAGDDDGNPRTVGDPMWTSYAANPPYQDHPSGFNCATGAFMYAGKEFFKNENIGFDVVRVAPGVANVVRSYTSFTEVVDDTIDARIYMGIHFRTPDEQGARLGREVAHWVSQHAFRPV
jgi:hypothetical protein